jgi:hypothetical protein
MKTFQLQEQTGVIQDGSSQKLAYILLLLLMIL